jgi:hypothetical protein
MKKKATLLGWTTKLPEWTREEQKAMRRAHLKKLERKIYKAIQAAIRKSNRPEFFVWRRGKPAPDYNVVLPSGTAWNIWEELRHSRQMIPRRRGNPEPVNPFEDYRDMVAAEVIGEVPKKAANTMAAKWEVEEDTARKRIATAYKNQPTRSNKKQK